MMATWLFTQNFPFAHKEQPRQLFVQRRFSPSSAIKQIFAIEQEIIYVVYNSRCTIMIAGNGPVRLSVSFTGIRMAS